MNLNDFNSALPKPFLNPQVNDLTANSITTGSINITGSTGSTGASFYVGRQYCSVSPLTVGSSANLTVDNLISGVIGCRPIPPSYSTILNLPSSSDLNAAIPPGITGTVYFNTQISQVCNVPSGPTGNTGSVQINLLPGYIGYNGEPSALEFSRDNGANNRFYTTLTFSKNPSVSSNWVIYG